MLLTQLLQKRILILDGAMGTMIQKHNFSEEDYRGEQFKNHPLPQKGNNDLLSITQSETIKEIHAEYCKAGADIIETNTFSSTSIGMADYGMESQVYALNYQSAKIAKQVAEYYTRKTPKKPRFVAGAIGPTNRTASMSPDVNRPEYRAITFDELKKAYKEQASALIAGGADILLVETIFDTLNAKAALYAIQDLKAEINKEIPIMVSGTITDASGRTLSGQTVEAFCISVSHVPLLSIGLNCALGAKQLTPYLETLHRKSKNPISVHPQMQDLPNAFGEYEQTPNEMGKEIKEYLEKRLVNILGGCCGTTPEHIKTLHTLAEKYKPRAFRNT